MAKNVVLIWRLVPSAKHPEFSGCVTQHLRPGKCGSLISLDAVDKTRDRACSGLRARIRPKRCLSICMGLVKCRMMRPVPVRMVLRWRRSKTHPRAASLPGGSPRAGVPGF